MAKGSFRFPLYNSGGAGSADPDVICPADGWIKPESPYTLPVPMPTPSDEEILLLCRNDGDKVVSIRVGPSPSGNMIYEVYDISETLLSSVTIASTTDFVLDFATYPGHDYLIIKALPAIATYKINSFLVKDVTGFTNRNWPIIYADFTKAPNMTTLIGAFQKIKLLQRVDFPATLNLLNSIGNAFYDTLIPWIKWPSSLPALTGATSAFRNNTALYTNYFPKNCPSNTGMSYAYYGCTSLQEHEMPGDLSNAGSMREYLYGCTNLYSLKLATNMDKATLMSNFLRNCSKLISKLVFPPLRAATSFYGMFWGCAKVPHIEFTGPSDFVTSCSYIASGCSELTYIKFPTSMDKVGDFASGFVNAAKLKKIVMPDYLGFVGQISMDYALGGTLELTEIDGTMECSPSTYIYLRNIGSTGTEKITSFNKPLAKFSYLDLGKNGGLLSYVEVDWVNSPWAASVTCVRLYGSLSQSEIERIFTALPTVAASQAIDVRYNPGYTTCDKTIATAKGWTVT